MVAACRRRAGFEEAATGAAAATPSQGDDAGGRHLILESLRAGVTFLPRAWSRPWFWALLAVTAVAGLALASVAEPASWLSPVIVLGSLFYLPLAQGPLFTLAMAEAPPEPTLPGGAARYARLVAVGLLTGVFLAVPGLLLFVVGLGTAYGLAWAYPGFNPMDATTWTANGPVLAGVGAVVGIGGLGILWLSARVGLGPPATVAERRVLMISTWPLTRGFAWRLAVARLIVSAGALGLAWVVGWVLGRVAPAGWPMRCAPVVGVMAFVAFRLPLKVGVLGYFYAHRSPLPATA